MLSPRVASHDNSSHDPGSSLLNFDVTVVTHTSSPEAGVIGRRTYGWRTWHCRDSPFRR